MPSENSNQVITNEGEWADPTSEQLGDGLNLDETHMSAQKTRFFVRTSLGGIKIRPRNKRRSTRLVL